jgi:hypothetical protein
MTARSTWKNWERRVAARLGGRRIPVSGIDRHGADVESNVFCYQVKLRQGMPAYLLDWLAGICATATCRGKVGVVIWKTPGRGRPDDDAVVVLRLRDWTALHGTPMSESPNPESPRTDELSR